MTPQEEKYFKALVEKRKFFSKELDDEDYRGIRELIKGNYSDRAHFIYELLQNADDAGATHAEFFLAKDKLLFKHDGKEKFTISNPNEKTGIRGHINAITSIGNSTKDYETNKIGKFGIGFKAVFQYTNSPAIFDDDVAFCIENFIIPKRLNFKHPARKNGETLFEFPFDKDDCPCNKAFKEISDKFLALDCPILFLSNLQTVKFEFGETVGIYKKVHETQLTFENTTAELLTINQYVNGKSEEQRLWLFSRKSDDRNYSVGYFLDKKGYLKSVDKPAFCFFPTKKITNLNFMIHAPFLLTPSREGIKAKEEHNVKMINLLSNLAADALIYLRKIGLIDDGILKIIPIEKRNFYCASDEISFMPFFTAIKNKMQTEELLPTGNGYVSSDNAYWADTKELTEIFSNKQLGEIVQNQNASWVFKTIPRKDNDIVSNYVDEITRNYLTGNAILEGRNDFYSKQKAKIIQGIDKKFIEAQPIDWFHKFYKWLSKTSDRISIAKIKPFFLDEKGKATAAFENDKAILFLPTEDGNYPTINSELLKNPETEKFLKENIGIKEPLLKDEIYTKILSRYKNNSITNDKSSFKKIFRYYATGCSRTESETYIKDIKEIIYFRTLDGKFASPNVLYMPEPELIEYFSAANLNPFLDKNFYLDLVAKKNESSLIEFFKKLGIATEVRNIRLKFGEETARNWNRNAKFLKDNLNKQQNIIRSFDVQDLEYSFDKWKNDDWHLKIPGSSYKINWFEGIIYGSINFLVNIFETNDTNKSFILWRRIVAFNDKVGKLRSSLVGSREQYYRKPKPYTPVNVILLRETAWLVDKSGNFKTPKEMTVNEMADNYDTISDSAREVIEFLGIRKAELEDDRLTADERRLIDKAKKLEELGATEEEFREFISQKRSKKQSAEKSLKESSQDNQSNVNDSSTLTTRSLSAKIIHNTLESFDEFEADADDYTPIAVDYKKKLERERAKNEIEQAKIKQLEECQQKVESFKEYSFGWFKALLGLEILNSNENKNNNKEISINFSRVKFDEGTKRTLILERPDCPIPQFMEEFENISLELQTTNEKKTTIEIEVAAVRNYTLNVKLKETSKIDNIKLDEVINANINVKNPDFLLKELQKQFNKLGYNDDYDMKENLCENIEFIFGPPGTGKTYNLAQKIITLMSESNDKKILVMTPTNKAADVLVNKIIELNETETYKEWLLRFGKTNDENIEKIGVFHDKDYDINSKHKNVTVTTIARFPYDFFTNDDKTYIRDINWDYIIIDEASMIMLVQILLPLYTKTPKKFIIAGDPFQIEPIAAVNLWEDKNIYKLVGLDKDDSFTNPITTPHNYYIELLKTQYRSLPTIGNIFSKFAYKGTLKHARTNREQRQLNIDNWLKVQTLNIVKFPVSKYESIYRSRRLGNSPYHIYSALFTFEFVKNLSKQLEENNSKEKFSIGVIAPYRIQANLIEKLFATEKKSDKINIQTGTIHTFQGDECDILIIVLNTPPNISSSHKIFLNRRNIINVAISRARDYMFLIMPDDKTKRIEELVLIKKVKKYFANEGYGEFSTQDIEELIFGEANYIEKNSFATGHQNVNIYSQPERKYEIRSEDNAVDIQIHEKH